MTMMNKNVQRRLWLILALLAMALAASSLTGCVDQNRGDSNETITEAEGSEADHESTTTLLEIDDPQEKAAVEAAKKKVAAMDEEPRIVATSAATADIWACP